MNQTAHKQEGWASHVTGCGLAHATSERLFFLVRPAVSVALVKRAMSFAPVICGCRDPECTADKLHDEYQVALAVYGQCPSEKTDEAVQLTYWAWRVADGACRERSKKL